MKRLIVATLLFLIGSATTLSLATPVVADDDLTKTARKALVAFTEGVLAGPEVLAPLLAPEYQIMRNNGVGYDRDGYLKRGVGTISAAPDFSHEEIIATRHGDMMVTRYYLRIDEVIQGNPIKKRAPRLTVFRLIDGVWKVVAHANFGATK